jgi:hypothetical protein
VPEELPNPKSGTDGFHPRAFFFICSYSLLDSAAAEEKAANVKPSYNCIDAVVLRG